VEPITGLAETLYSARAFQAFTLRWFWEDIACNGFQPVTVALCQGLLFLLVLINALLILNWLIYEKCENRCFAENEIARFHTFG
jgi:hypothetical protein